MHGWFFPAFYWSQQTSATSGRRDFKLRRVTWTLPSIASNVDFDGGPCAEASPIVRTAVPIDPKRDAGVFGPTVWIAPISNDMLGGYACGMHAALIPIKIPFRSPHQRTHDLRIQTHPAVGAHSRGVGIGHDKAESVTLGLGSYTAGSIEKVEMPLNWMGQMWRLSSRKRCSALVWWATVTRAPLLLCCRRSILMAYCGFAMQNSRRWFFIGWVSLWLEIVEGIKTQRQYEGSCAYHWACCMHEWMNK